MTPDPLDFSKTHFQVLYSFLLNDFMVKWIVLNLLPYEQMNNKKKKKSVASGFCVNDVEPYDFFLIINSGVSRKYREKT